MSDLTPEQISLLADKWLKGTISREEKELFEAWYNNMPEGTVEWTDETIHSGQALRQHLLQQITQRIKDEGKGGLYQRLPLKQWRMAAAAVLLLLFSAGGYLYLSKRQGKLLSSPNNALTAQHIVPGSNKATLTLANGTVIALEDEKNGVLSQQGNAKIVKLNSGQLAYNTARQPSAGSPAAFNTLSTPRGGQYQLTLADGTVVWLNAASSLTFPTAFSGKERGVTLSGEAYFEIAANASQPFIVKVGNMQVKVLGTHFNVMAYGDEQTMNTTLLEGAVKVSGATREVLLQPGQQVRMDQAGALKVAAANLDEVIAWKNGIFSFNNAGIEEVMRQIARWYDAEVVYPDGIPQDRFQGEINRNADIGTVLKILETSGVKFTVQGHKILVQP